MSRPTFQEIYMVLAAKMSERSTCARLQVGCAIVTPDSRKVLAVGYNGNVAGGKNDCDRHGAEAVGNCGCLHAEENAVINCDVSRNIEKIVFCTHLPCIMCAKRLINLGGVQKVLYQSDYRIKDSLLLFAEQGINTYHLLPEDKGEAPVAFKRARDARIEYELLKFKEEHNGT
jgi:dCMP deaminase